MGYGNRNYEPEIPHYPQVTKLKQFPSTRKEFLPILKELKLCIKLAKLRKETNYVFEFKDYYRVPENRGDKLVKWFEKNFNKENEYKITFKTIFTEDHESWGPPGGFWTDCLVVEWK